MHGDGPAPVHLAAFVRGAPLLALTSCIDFTLHGQDDPVVEPVVVEEHFSQEPLPRVDILWVIDDTPSMTEEHSALLGALPDLVTTLDAFELAWQAGVVTTDVADDSAGVLQGNPWILTPDDPQLEQAMDVGVEGAEPAAGLGAAWLALQEPLGSAENRGFRREDAGLHVVVFSDGDDHSEDLLGSSPADAFIEFLDEQAQASGHQAVLSAVVGDEGTGCTGAGGTAQPGDAYLQVATATGGTVSSICETDLTSVIEAIGDRSISWQDTFTLQAHPIEDSIRVAVDDVRQDQGWSFEPALPAIVFDAPPAPGALISVRYQVSEP